MREYRNFASLEKFVLELVLNSLKANSTAIAVRIDLNNQRIQVVDNGSGIAKNALNDIGEYPTKDEGPTSARKMKSKDPSGSLMDIREISKVMIVASKSQSCSETYAKFFSNDQPSEISRIENRPTEGTTVTVYVSKEFCDWGNEIDSFAVRFTIVYLALVNKQVSFSVRDDSTGSVLLRIGKQQKREQLLKVICEPVTSSRIKILKTRICENVDIVCFWRYDCTSLRKIQQILLNLRPVRCFELEDGMTDLLKKFCCSRVEKHINPDNVFFLLYIECPDSEYIFPVKNDECVVHLYDTDKILLSVEKYLIKNHSKSLKSSIHEPVVAPLISRPIGRTLGLKRKKSLLTRVARQSFENGAFFCKRESRVESKSKNRTVQPSEKRFRKDASQVSHRNQEEISLAMENNEVKVARKAIDESQNETSKLRRTIVESSEAAIAKKSKDFENLPLIIQECNEETPDHHGSQIVQSTSPVLSSALKVPERNSRPARISQKIETCSSNIDAPKSQESNSNKGTAEKVNENKSFEKLQSSRVSQRKDNDPFVKEYQYENHSFSWISQKCAEKLTNSVEEIYISGCSQWSDWTYESEQRDDNTLNRSKELHPTICKRFKFLPLKLHALLQFGNAKFISRAEESKNDEIIGKRFGLNLNHRRHDLDVRPCIRRSFEIRLKLETLQSMKVVNQVNHEFIVAMTKQDGKKLLVMIDQHAMHERIRYENLLRAYRRDQKNNQFTSVSLHRPIMISDFSTETCELLEANRRLLIRYGLSLAFRDEKTFLILTVPRCFPKKSYHADNTEVENLVRKLLQEVLDHLNSNGTAKFLPFTIHDAIASEACHGAIKFGNPLTVEQCESLVTLWRETEAPNRCAHGRPSVIPLLELSVLKRNRFTSQEKLNFASLRNSRRTCKGTRFHPYIEGNFREFQKFQFGDETSC